MANSFNDIMAALKAEKENYEFKQTVKKVYSRPKNYYNKLSNTVKKAGHQSPGGLDCFKDENRFYSPKETQRYLEGTSYYETYSAMRSQDEYE